MWFNSLFELTLNEPVIVFAIFIAVLLPTAPVVLRECSIPGLAGLIPWGLLIGQYGINWFATGENVQLVGTAGLLFLFFLAGLEINSRNLLSNRNKSVFLGALTFFIPLVFVFFVAYFRHSYNLLASFLVATMFLTKSLIFCPIFSRFGISRNKAVTMAMASFRNTILKLINLQNLVIRSEIRPIAA